MDDVVWRLIPSEQHGITTSTTDLPPKDKCEPLYVLVYAHCCVWFLFLVSYMLLNDQLFILITEAVLFWFIIHRYWTMLLDTCIIKH